MLSFKLPEDNEKYIWTSHVKEKMKYYKLSASRIKRVIRAPERTEEGIVEGTVVSMKAGGNKNKEEVWVMYKLVPKEEESKNNNIPGYSNDKIKIITAWRYPGKTKKGNPVPDDILREIQSII